jgi:hypothetical protein
MPRVRRQARDGEAEAARELDPAGAMPGAREAVNPFRTTDQQRVNVARFASEMDKSGLPSAFIAAAMDLAWHEQGAYDLMELWSEAHPGKEREEIVADLQDAVDEWAEAPRAPQTKPRIDFDQLDGVAKSVMAHKRRLRELIDRHGGVSAVARKSGIPQPSLSRLLSSASMPRRSTLYRIANALGVDESEIVTEWVR